MCQWGAANVLLATEHPFLCFVVSYHCVIHKACLLGFISPTCTPVYLPVHNYVWQLFSLLRNPVCSYWIWRCKSWTWEQWHLCSGMKSVLASYSPLCSCYILIFHSLATSRGNGSIMSKTTLSWRNVSSFSLYNIIGFWFICLCSC